MEKLKLTELEKQYLIERIQMGEDIPVDFKYKLFPTLQKEYELVYGGKMRREDILADEDGVSAVPLQVEKVFNGERNLFDDGWRNIIVFGDNLQFLKTIYKNQDPLIKDKVKGKVKLIYIDPPFGTGDEYDGNTAQRAYSAKRKGADFVEFLRRRVVIAKEILADDGLIFIRLSHHFGHYAKVLFDEIFGKANFTNELVVNRIKKNVTQKGRRNIPTAIDIIYVYKKTQQANYSNVVKKLKQQKKGYWHSMDSPGIPGPRKLFISGRVFYPPEGTHFKYTQKDAEEKYKEGKLRVNPKTDKLQYWVEPKDEINLDTNWTDIPGYSFTTKYPTENSEKLLERVIQVGSKENDIVLDFFGGSGTTAAVAEKLNRKWIVCDIGKLAFYTIQKRILSIETSKSLSNPSKKYGLKAKSFITVNTGLYDLPKLFELQKEEYIRFVMNLFEVTPQKKIINGINIHGERKDGYNVLIWEYWNFEDAAVDEVFLEHLHNAIGNRLGDRLYLIAPANKVQFIDDYYQIDRVRYYFLKVPYQIIQELHKAKFKKFRQPTSKSDINALEDAIGFHFIRQPEVKSSFKNGLLIVNEFAANYPDEETGKDIPGFEALAMIIVDKNYNGKEFVMSEAFFAEDLLKKGSDKIEIKLNSYGERIGVVYVDLYGNEFREELKTKA